MYELLLPLIVVLFLVVKTREHFYLKVDPAAVVPVKTDPNDTIPTSWNNGRTLYSTDSDTNMQGHHIVGTYPDSCADGRENDAGLCYDKCKPGYEGLGPLCHNKFFVQVGKPIGLTPCPHGWVNHGFTCWEPIRCGSGWDFFKKGCSGGRVKGRTAICDWPQDRGNLPDWLLDKSDPKNYKATHPELRGLLCYERCPKSHPHRKPWALASCYADDGPVSYERGFGKIPCTVRLFGKCVFDAGGGGG